MSMIEDLKNVKRVDVETSTNYFFKTREGQYQAGDFFWNIRSADLTAIVKKTAPTATLAEIEGYLADPIHEIRSCGVSILTEQMKKADPAKKKQIFDFYLAHLERVNGWDLVDISAPGIVGQWILETGKDEILDDLAASNNLWRRRTAIISTLRLIKHGKLDATFRITEKLLNDKEDLIHKACGWMLRETGKIDRGRLNRFLKEHYAELPRTTLRYAIERHDKTEYKNLLKGIFREE